jgi:hypothetical protein
MLGMIPARKKPKLGYVLSPLESATIRHVRNFTQYLGPTELVAFMAVSTTMLSLVDHSQIPVDTSHTSMKARLHNGIKTLKPVSAALHSSQTVIDTRNTHPGLQSLRVDQSYGGLLDKLEELLVSANLTKLTVCNCQYIRVICIPRALHKGHNDRLWYLSLLECNHLMYVADTEHCKNLTDLRIGRCPELRVNVMVMLLASLERLYISNMHMIHNLDGLQSLKCLKTLHIKAVSQLVTLPELVTLERLVLSNNVRITSYQFLAGCKKLRCLSIRRQPQVLNLGSAIEDLPSLTDLELDCCGVQSVPWSENLKSVILTKCHTMFNVSKLNECDHLELFIVFNCPYIRRGQVDYLHTLISSRSTEKERLEKLQDAQSLDL